ncbi:AAA family ATPase, partial [Streptomyces edwardsiae]
PKWRQERLDVELNVTGSRLEVLIAEGHSTGSTTTFDERSDGLRTFVALVAFLARQEYQLPPVLLVDEIETHLHLDAQADLVEVLTNDVEASQVFYTTHSPASLPRDLGTGLRLVRPDPSNRSVSLLRNDFWTSGPGYT